MLLPLARDHVITRQQLHLERKEQLRPTVPHLDLQAVVNQPIFALRSYLAHSPHGHHSRCLQSQGGALAGVAIITTFTIVPSSTTSEKAQLACAEEVFSSKENTDKDPDKAT